MAVTRKFRDLESYFVQPSNTSIFRYVANKKYVRACHYHFYGLEISADWLILSEKNETIRPSYRVRNTHPNELG